MLFRSLYISENKAASYLKTIETVDEPEKTLLYNWRNTKLKGLSKDGKAIKLRADGSTVIKVYYDRNTYTLQFRDVTDDYVYRPVKSGDAGRKQYGLVDGKYRVLTMHKRNVKTWKMDNYLIAKGNTPNEQYTIDDMIFYIENPKDSTQKLLELIHKFRSEERRVGKECLRLCRSRWSPYH